MTIEATATALAADEAQSAEPVATPEATEQSDDQELQAVWDAMQADAEDKTEAKEPEQPDDQEAADETAETPEDEAAEEESGEDDDAAEKDDEGDKPEVEAPSELPKSVRDAWGEIPEDARGAILESHRKMGRQLAEQGRLMHGLKPIQDVLTNAVQELPALANMQPDQVAQQVMALAKISNDFDQKPVETMMGLIKQHRLEEPLR